MVRIASLVVGVGLSLAVPSTAWAISVTCDSPLGECQLSNDGQDQASCTCEDAIGGGIFGGMAWAGLSEGELLVECDAFLESWCDPDPPLYCSDATGTCNVDTDPDSFACDCVDGSTPSGGGGNAWTGLSDDELAQVCVEQLAACPPVAPPDGVLCEDDHGYCTVDSEGSWCQCDDGQEFGGGGPGIYEGYTEAELLGVCEQELAFCGAPGAETGISDSDDGPGDDGPGDDGPGDDGPGDDGPGDDGPGDDGPGDDGPGDDGPGDDGPGDDGPGDDGPGDDGPSDDGPGDDGPGDDDDDDDDGTADGGATDGPDPEPDPDPEPSDTDGTGDTDGPSAGQTPDAGGCRVGNPTLPVPAALGLLLFGFAARRRRAR